MGKIGVFLKYVFIAYTYIKRIKFVVKVIKRIPWKRLRKGNDKTNDVDTDS